MGDLTAVNGATIILNNKDPARMQIAGFCAVLSRLAPRFLAEHNAFGQLEHVGVAERPKLWRPLGARTGSRYR
jgi:hypothetical protein